MRNHSAIRFAAMLATLAVAGILAIAWRTGRGTNQRRVRRGFIPTIGQLEPDAGSIADTQQQHVSEQPGLPETPTLHPRPLPPVSAAMTEAHRCSRWRRRLQPWNGLLRTPWPAPRLGTPAPATMTQARSAQGAGSPQQGPTIPPESGGTENPNDGAFPLVYFEHYGVNPFIDADEDPLSTFALDGDTASYEILKLFLNNGHLAEPDSVRVEEYINSLPQNYTPTETALGLHLDAGPAPFGDEGYVLLRVGVSNPAPTDDRDPVSLIFVVDVSGSMEADNRLGLVKEVIEGIADRMIPSDRAAIVTYANGVRVAREFTDGDNTRDIVSTARGLRAGGSTLCRSGLAAGLRHGICGDAPGSQGAFGTPVRWRGKRGRNRPGVNPESRG